MAEEGFEEVGLNDEVKPKKRSLFGFGHNSNDEPNDANRPSSSHHNISSFIPGRKRGDSGRGAELRSMPRPGSTQGPQVKPAES